MPWDAASFHKHNHGLAGKSGSVAAKVATAALKRGLPEGQAIAEGNAVGDRLKARGYNSVSASAPHGTKPHQHAARGGGLHAVRAQLESRLRRDLGGATTFDMMRPPVMPAYARADMREQMSAPNYGFLNSALPGRTDRIGANLPSGSYVIPADVVAGLGEGNSLAGASVIDRMMHTEPFGIEPPHNTEGPGVKMPPVRPPSLGEVRQLRNLQTNPGAYEVAKGGAPGKPQPERHPRPKHASDKVGVVLAGGEMVIPPEMVAHHPKLGGLPAGDTNPQHYQMALKNGHAVLDRFVEMARAHHIKTLQKLPGPVKS